MREKRLNGRDTDRVCRIRRSCDMTQEISPHRTRGSWDNIIGAELMGISRRFVFNIDQTGCPEYIDSQKATNVFPIDYPNPSVPVPANCHTKRSTFIMCIAADGYRRRPSVIVDRATVEAGEALSGGDGSNGSLA
jgi:hypothetical protein